MDDARRQRLQGLAPGRLFMPLKFGGQFEKPCPAIGSLIPTRQRPVEIGAFSGDLLSRQHLSEQVADRIG